MEIKDTTERIHRTWKQELTAIVVLVAMGGLLPLIISSCDESGCSIENQRTTYPGIPIQILAMNRSGTVVPGGWVERELLISGDGELGSPTAVVIEWTPPPGLSELEFATHAPENPAGPPPFRFSGVPVGSSNEPERFVVRYVAPADVRRGVTDTFEVLEPERQSTVFASSLTSPVIGGELFHRRPPSAGTVPDSSPSHGLKALTGERDAWLSQQWIYAHEGVPFDVARCNEVFGPVSSGHFFMAVHYPERAGGGVPIVLSDGHQPRISLLDYTQPSDQREVLSFDLEMAPERMSWISDNLTGSAGYEWTALRPEQATVPMCPADIAIEAGSWEFYNETLIDYADDPDQCNGCVLEQLFCWEGQEPPYEMPMLLAAMPWTVKSIQADGVTCIGPGAIRLYDRSNPPDPAFTMHAGEITVVEHPPARVVFHHWLNNFSGSSSYSISLTAESSQGIQWQFYDNEAATSHLSQPVSLPTSSSREIWVAADIPADASGFESVRIVATAASAPASPIWGTDIVQIGPWVPPSAASIVRWIPVASRAQGVGGSQWRTDIGLLNPGVLDSEARLRLHLNGVTHEESITVAAGSQRILGDVVGMFGVDGSGALEVDSDHILITTSRTFSLLAADDPCYANGTFGQFLVGSGISAGLAAGQSGRLPQLAESSSYRTNVAVTNAGTDPASVTVVLFDDSGTEITRFDVTLDPGEWKQENRVFFRRANRNDLDAASAEIRVTSGSGVLAYASVVDNITTDPTTIPLIIGGGFEASWVPVASRADGVGGSRWRTDLGLLNPGSAQATATVRYHSGGETSELQVTLESGQQHVVADLVGEFAVSGSGSVEVVSSQPIVVTSRTYSRLADDDGCSPGGTFGQFLAARNAADGLAAGESGLLPQLAENPAYRTNLALTNSGSQPAEATVVLLDESGVEITRFVITLAPGEWKQENRVFSRRGGRSDLVAASARIDVTAGSGVLAYASVVDNVTSDPTTIPLQR